MKYLKFLIPIAFMFFACEEIVEYVEVEKPIYLEKIITVIDTIETVIEKEVIRVDTVYRIDTVKLCRCTETIYDTLYLTEEKVIYDTLIEFVEVVDTVFVERSAVITYPPQFEQYVNNFFILTEDEDRGEIILVDTELIIYDDGDNATPRLPDTWGNLSNEGIKIFFREDGCYEGAVYRELAHYLRGVPYKNDVNVWEESERATDYIMTRGWNKCMETMSEEDRQYYLDDLFGRFSEWLYITIDPS